MQLRHGEKGWPDRLRVTYFPAPLALPPALPVAVRAYSHQVVLQLYWKVTRRVLEIIYTRLDLSHCSICKYTCTVTPTRQRANCSKNTCWLDSTSAVSHRKDVNIVGCKLAPVLAYIPHLEKIAQFNNSSHTSRIPLRIPIELCYI